MRSGQAKARPADSGGHQDKALAVRRLPGGVLVLHPVGAEIDSESIQQAFRNRRGKPCATN